MTIQQDEDGWSIHSTDLPGLLTAAETLDEAWLMWPDAVTSWAQAANDARVECERAALTPTPQSAPVGTDTPDGALRKALDYLVERLATHALCHGLACTGDDDEKLCAPHRAVAAKFAAAYQDPK